MQVQQAGSGRSLQPVPLRSTRWRKRAASASVRAEVAQGSTASGLEINGMRPTSNKAWEVIATTLRRRGVKFISRDEVAAAAARGAPVVDVRPAGDWRESHVPGAASAEFYRLIQGWDATKIARRVAFTFFGVVGTEYNPDFLAQVEAAAPNKGTPVILYCQIGGSLEPWGSCEWGRQSRSLTAAYELLQADYRSVQVMEGGYCEWAKEERDAEVED